MVLILVAMEVVAMVVKDHPEVAMKGTNVRHVVSTPPTFCVSAFGSQQ